MLEMLKKLESLTVKFNKLVILIGGAALPILISIGVFFRYVLKKDFLGIEEIEIYIAILLYFIGAALASYTRCHISADLTQSMIKNQKIRKFFAIFTASVTVVIAILVTYCTTDLVAYAIKMKPTTSVWKIPLVTEYIVVLYAFVLMFLYAIRDLYNAIFSKTTE